MNYSYAYWMNILPEKVKVLNRKVKSFVTINQEGPKWTFLQI